jgi:uncharacterized iron-regulated protein
MKNVEDMKRLATEIISSYESRIAAVGMIIDTTHQLLDDFRTKRNEISNQLKETLAHKESMRKKDFDKIMNDILSSQDEKEEEIRNLLKTYIAEHKEAASSIRENLEKNEMARAEDEKSRIENFRKMFHGIQEQQQCRENEVREKLLEFQQDHKKTTEFLRTLLDKDEAVRASYLKTMLKDIRAQRTQRKEEINAMSFHWRELTGIMAEKRAERQNI